MANMIQRFMVGYKKLINLITTTVTSAISNHNTDKAAHPNGFNHTLTIEGNTEPTINVKCTGGKISQENLTMGMIGFIDANNNSVGFIDAECTGYYNALDVHVGNISSPGPAYKCPTVCSFKTFASDTYDCRLDMCYNSIVNTSIIDITSKDANTEPALHFNHPSTNGTENKGLGAIYFRASNISVVVLDADTHKDYNCFNIHVQNPIGTGTSSNITSIAVFCNDIAGNKYLDMLNNEIRRAKCTVSENDNEFSIVNKKWVSSEIRKIAEEYRFEFGLNFGEWNTSGNGLENGYFTSVYRRCVGSGNMNKRAYVTLTYMNNKPNTFVSDVILHKHSNLTITNIVAISFSGTTRYNGKVKAYAEISTNGNVVVKLISDEATTTFASGESVQVVCMADITA